MPKKKSTKPKHEKKPVVQEPEQTFLPDTPELDPDAIDLPESEADKMVDEVVEAEKAEIKKLEVALDSQDWTLADPVIPEALKEEVWIAVYKCPSGHKTKATNRQSKSGVKCWRCKEDGQTVKADIMPQFMDPPIAADPDTEQRRKAKRGTL